MQTFLLVFVLILLAVAGLAAGVMLGRQPLKGSCGGLNCIEGADCGACGRSREP